MIDDCSNCEWNHSDDEIESQCMADDKSYCEKNVSETCESCKLFDNCSVEKSRLLDELEQAENIDAPLLLNEGYCDIAKKLLKEKLEAGNAEC